MVATQPSAGLSLSFATAFLSACAAVFTFNLLDLLVLDWLVFVTWRPRYIVLSGTEGPTGYGDYAFHFRGFLKGLVFCLAAGLLTALATLGVSALASLVV